MSSGEMARLFHRLTSYEPAREWTDTVHDPWIVTSFEPNDLAILPPPMKAFPPGLPVVQLPRDLPTSDADMIAVLAGETPAGQELDLPQLARLLHLSAGVVRTRQWSGGTFYFRAAGSAGGRFPLEVYAIVPEDAADLPPGVHAYAPLEHALVRVGPPPAAGPPALVLTGVPWRTGWRYRERGYRHIFWDAGTVLSQQLALAAGAGLAPRLFTDFPDLDVRDLVGADGIHEFPIAVVALGDGPPRPPAIERGAAGSAAGESPVHFPLVTAAHWAGIAPGWGEPWQDRDVVEAAPSSPPVDEVIYRRGSTRLMDPAGSVPRAFLETALGVALRGIDLPHFVAVHAVDDVAPGLYRWPELSRPVHAGDLRAELRRIALGQGLAGEAAFVAIGAADLTSISDRRYRELQLAAGIVAGRLHLAAYALGYGASGMTFLDSEIPGLLREDLAAMLFTCVGVPEYRNKPGGKPGAPATVRPVMPRLDD